MAKANTGQKVFKASMVLFFLASAVVLAVAALLVSTGLKGLRCFPAAGGDPLRYVSGFLPIGIAILLFLLIVFLFLANFRRKIGICKTHFIYSSGYGKPKTIPWNEMVYTKSRDKGLPILKAAFVTHNSSVIHFERFFFPQYDEICKILDHIYAHKDNIEL